jgi:hypothetical protein
MNWLKGLAAAFIGGGANVITVIVVDPVAFNFGAEWKKTLTAAVVGGIIAAAMYLKQSPLPDGSSGSSGGSGGSTGAGTGFGVTGRVLPLLLVSALSLSSSACWFGGSGTATSKLIAQLDNNSLTAREAQAALKQLADLKLAAPGTVVSFGTKVEVFRSTNRQVIDFFDQPEFKKVNEKGERVITLTEDGKIKVEALIKSLVTSAQAITADKALFPNLNDSTRASLNALFAAAGETAKTLTVLLNRLKTIPAKTSFLISPADWQTLQNAKGEIYAD